MLFRSSTCKTTILLVESVNETILSIIKSTRHRFFYTFLHSIMPIEYLVTFLTSSFAHVCMIKYNYL